MYDFRAQGIGHDAEGGPDRATGRLRAHLDLRDPSLVATVLPLLRLVMKRWFRSEVRDIERVPDEGGVLIVSNHSGGLGAGPAAGGLRH